MRPREKPAGVALAVVLAATAVAGCGTDLPECDPAAARRVAFQSSDDDSLDSWPAYEGQALMQVSCGGGEFCHSPAAEKDRSGVPLGFDFDVRIVDWDGAPERLREDLRRVRSHRELIATVVDRGLMPPGREAEEKMEALLVSSYRRGPEPEAPELPSIESDEGERILRNWLACDAPVVETMQEPTGDMQPGDHCGDGPAGIGSCVVGVSRDEVAAPEPTWPAIFTEVLFPRCGNSCHGPGTADLRDLNQLDMSEMDLAYEELVNEPASGTACNGEGPRVEPGNPEGSLLIRKLRADDEGRCGQRMPVGGALDAAVVDAIRQWIADGALEVPMSTR